MEPERYSNKASEALLVVASAISTSSKCKVEDGFLSDESYHISLHLCLRYKYRGYFRKAEEMYQVVLAGHEKLLGTDHPDTLGVVHNMAVVLGKQGQYNKALELYERVLAGREKALGADHPNTFAVASIGWERKTIGSRPPSTLSTVHGMAIIFKLQRRYNKAQEWYERALDGTEKVLGAGYPETLLIIGNMVIFFDAMGQPNKIREFRERASRYPNTPYM
ncbi:hypothetical protein BDZ91DRAFT_796228 [Kalaharituber pfeilii]|nr:hypothetical protein BDZ91DRAFT_796228 [Kalaharituber pfeilii]